jgi:hypothetical protein
MLNRADKWYLAYLATGYVAFAEILSWETSKWPACLVASEYQNASYQAGNGTCATLHEGVMRFLAFIWGYVTHDNVSAAAAVVVAIFTLTLWRSTRLLWLSSEHHSERQLRAYLSVVIGAAVYQDRALELRFEAKPLILNNGDTPAYHVRVSIKSDILTDEQALAFVFTEPAEAPQSQASIGPKENRIMSAILDRFVPDDQIDDICNGRGQALYVWGTVRYEDAFGHRRFTQFAQKLWWLRDRSNVMGNYDGRFGLSD